MQDLERRVAAIEAIAGKLPRQVPFSSPGMEIADVDEFPEITVGMKLRFIKRWETGVGWTVWHAQGESSEEAGDGDTFWVPAFARFTSLTGEPGT